MFTRLDKITPDTVTITSADETVRVTVERIDGEMPDGPLTRAEAHDALVKAEVATHEFLTAVEADVHATAPN